MLLARKEETGTRTQSLREHSQAVAEMTAGHCAPIGLKALGELAGLLHDSGKAYPAWQAYLQNPSAAREVVFHSGPGVWFARRLFEGRSQTGADLTLQMLCLAIRGHHGGLHDVLTPAGQPDEPLPLSYSPDHNSQAEQEFFAQIAPKDRLDKLFEQACEEVCALFQKALEISNLKITAQKRQAQNELMVYLGLTQRFLYSALIDADRADAAAWEQQAPEVEPPPPQWDVLMEKLEKTLDGFDREGINALRGRIADACRQFVADPAGVYRLYLPTGAGKTLSGLALALQNARRWQKNKIFFIVPYLTILEQNARAIRQALGEDPDAFDSVVLEHASNVVFEEDEEGEQELLYRRLTERWHQPDIIMTSSVQFLNALFSGQSAAARRMRALANSVIVVDEVQAIPSECFYLFNMAVNFLAYFCNCIVILCTATPPALSTLPYPVRMSRPSDIFPNADELFRAFKRTELVFEDHRRGMEPEALADYIWDKFRQNGNCLAVMNTKSVAFQLYQRLSSLAADQATVVYLSTELCSAHRAKLIEQIRQLLDARQPVICISTQLIEAGVDISFECVVRALAGLDSIIQAAGRCNRHGQDPVKKVYVVPCADERLDMLRDILAGKLSTCKLLTDFQTDPEKLGGNLLSPSAILQYYRYYFGAREKALGYSLGEGRNAVELLGFSEKARVAYQQEYRTSYRTVLLAQAFRTVGRAFTPIAGHTTGVVVPYGGCEELLKKLFAADSARDQRRCYRRLQQYTVNVYAHTLAELQQKGAVTFYEKQGIWVLNPGFYHEQTGIRISQAGLIDNYIC